METKQTWESRKRSREDKNENQKDTTPSPPPTKKDADADGLKSSTTVPTATQFIVGPDEFLALPPELKDVDFTKRVSWRKFAPYTDQTLQVTPVGQEPVFQPESPALCFHVNATSGRARATTLHLPSNRPVATPIFMPVGYVLH